MEADTQERLVTRRWSGPLLFRK